MKRKNETFSQAIVGLFMVAVILLLAYFTIVISGVDILAGRNRVPIRIVFSQVGGLKDRDNVMYRGTKVGAVDHVEVGESNLVVVAMIDSKVILRSGYSASVCNLSMLGGYYLKLEEGTGDALPLSETEFRGETPTDWMQDISQIARNLTEFTSRSELTEVLTNASEIAMRVRRMAEKAEAIVTRVERGEGTVGKLLSSDDTVYNDIKATAAGAKDMVSGAKDMVSGATKAFDNIAKISDDIRSNGTMDDLKGGMAAFRKAAEGMDPGDLMAKARELADNLNLIARGIREGDGTLGKLANDASLYNELDALIKDCRQVLDNYRDTTPISTFSSLATGAL